MDESQEQNNSRPWLYKKGQSGNPGGRPVGSKSMKTYIKEKLATMTDEEREIYLDGLPKQIVWAMAEGNPTDRVEAKVDATVTTSHVVKDVTEKLNEIFRGNSVGSDGESPSAVDTQTPNPQ